MTSVSTEVEERVVNPSSIQLCSRDPEELTDRGRDTGEYRCVRYYDISVARKDIRTPEVLGTVKEQRRRCT